MCNLLSGRFAVYILVGIMVHLEAHCLALTNQSSRYWWILMPFCIAINLTSFATTVNSMDAVDRPNGSALNVLGLTLDVKPHMYFLD